MAFRRFDLNPVLTIECPFCGKMYEINLDDKPCNFEIECWCGALIEGGCDFEWGRATINNDRDRRLNYDND